MSWDMMQSSRREDARPTISDRTVGMAVEIAAHGYIRQGQAVNLAANLPGYLDLHIEVTAHLNGDELMVDKAIVVNDDFESLGDFRGQIKIVR